MGGPDLVYPLKRTVVSQQIQNDPLQIHLYEMAIRDVHWKGARSSASKNANINLFDGASCDGICDSFSEYLRGGESGGMVRV